jgi:hypothetical protein
VVSNWTVKIATNGASIDQIWSASQTTSGTTMTVTPAAHNQSIPAGGSVDFGYCGSGNKRPAVTSITVSGGTVGAGGATATGGTKATGGANAKGGATAAGGMKATGGTTAKGGSTAAGGTKATGGATSAGATSSVGGGLSSHATYAKPRVIATTDGEVDDRSSFVRFLMYASDYDVVGIVQNNSKFQKDGHSSEKWVEKELELYSQALPNLRVHNSNYPDAAKLRGVMRVGNENRDDLYTAPASMKTKETPGSKLIIEELLNSDPRPLHVAVWGGANTLAYALYQLKTEQPAKLAQVLSKLWIYCIWYQDGGGQWIEDNIPGVNIYEAYQWDNVWDYQSLTGPSPDYVKAYMTKAWLDTNVKKNHGALGAYTPQSYVSEGDTPSFLPLINNGLFQHVNYTWGGWGGRPVFTSGTSGHMTDKGKTTDDGDANKSFWRWIPTLENDFAGRMDWAVASKYSGANHNPVAAVVGGVQRNVAAGSTVTLDASPSKDPDGNSLSYKWWQYHDADSASAKVTIANETAKTGASFKVPSEPGKNVHIILEVTDNGVPSMAHYQRIIFSIK